LKKSLQSKESSDMLSSVCAYVEYKNPVGHARGESAIRRHGNLDSILKET
jgi:hypothetical protein